jgi:2'-5' RNA ligase
MAFAINLRSDNASAERLHALWHRCDALENTSSMAALNYPPHITLAVFDEDPGELAPLLKELFTGLPELRIRFTSLGMFRAPHGLVLWAAPELPEILLMAHRRIHASVNPDHSRRNYQPERWVPHSTIANGVSPARLPDIESLIAEPLDSFEVRFDVVDYVEYPPVRVIAELPLE